MQYRLSRCDFQSAGQSECRFNAMYRVTVVSAEGPTCEMLLCAQHVEHSWNAGVQVLKERFPKLNLTMDRVLLDPVLRTQAAFGD